MRKERMTSEEVNEFNPSYNNRMVLVSDDNVYSSLYRKIEIITPIIDDNYCCIIENGDLRTFHKDALKHYPSLKAEPLTFEKIKRECVPTETILVDTWGVERVYFGFFKGYTIKPLTLITENKKSGAVRRDWQEEEIKNWEILEGKW